MTGIGHTKRVVLYDNLIERFSRDQINSIVAHELGHVRHRDVPRGLLWVVIVAPAGMFLIQRLSERWAPAGRGAGGGARGDDGAGHPERAARARAGRRSPARWEQLAVARGRAQRRRLQRST